MELKLVFKFDAAHRLQHYRGECANLHGHTWRVVVVVKGHIKDSKDGIIVDFKELKEEIKDALPDHRDLNVFYGLTDPTAEVIACRLYTQIHAIITDKAHWPVMLKSVEVWESDTASAKVENEYL